MERQSAIESLKQHAADLRDRGVIHLSVFGPTARGEAGPESDIDLLVDIDAGHQFTLVKLAQLRNFLNGILDAEADTTIREDIKPLLRDSIFEDEIRVF